MIPSRRTPDPRPQTPDPQTFRVVILKFDRDAVTRLQRRVRAALPGASCTVVRTVAEAKRVLASGVPDMFVTGLEAPDGDPLDLLWRATAGPNAVRHSLVVTRQREPWLLEALCSLPVGGVCDLVDDAPENIVGALRAVVEGRRYWSRSLLQMIGGPGLARRQLRLLTPTERVVLALMGDGRDATAAGAFLDLKTRSIESVLARLRGKLDAHQKAELPVWSARLGFVRFAADLTIRVGFGLLLAGYYARSQRPLAPTPELRAAYPEAAVLADLRRSQSRLRAA